MSKHDRLQTVQKMQSELKRVDDALELYAEFLKECDDRWNFTMSQQRGLVKHRVIDLKYTLTRLVRELYN